MMHERLKALTQVLEYEIPLMWNKDCYLIATDSHVWIPYELSNIGIGDIPIVRFTLFLQDGSSKESLECSTVFMSEVKDRVKELMEVLDAPFKIEK